ncbi:MAG: hypothetical protein M1454_03120 [Candidatus Thermoplasmatota archaeon]|nr:hypothetical protein [Candidatus Thermoplasmatota archaeon]MCL5731674.1 hypothetical protein [Candidatus Thermoplasmatota archaeon]
MNYAFYLLMITAVIATLHMIAPDHWIPISALASKRHYAFSRTAATSFSIGTAHGLTSTILSLLVGYLGIYIFGVAYVKLGSVILLVAVSVYIVINSFLERKAKEVVENTSLVVSFLPDPAFLPIILLATGLGNIFVAELSIFFIGLSGIALLTVVLLVRISLFRRIEKLEPYLIDYIVSAVLIGTAAFIFFT